MPSFDLTKADFNHYSDEEKHYLLAIFASCSLIEGKNNPPARSYVLDIAKTMNITPDYLEILEKLIEGKEQDVIDQSLYYNWISIFGSEIDSVESIVKKFKCYDHFGENKGLARCYKQLAFYPEDTLGYQFYKLYTDNHYQFPGETGSFIDAFANAHDSVHILANYNTQASGEILTSTFTAMMHKKQGLSGHIIPVILVWDRNVKAYDIVKTNQDKLNVTQFWQAWYWGEKAKVDIFDNSWCFWDHVDKKVAKLRKQYRFLCQ